MNKQVLKNIAGTIAIPGIFFLITSLVCASHGIALFSSQGNWVSFFRAVAGVAMTTFALSINLGTGRFDFSIGAVALLSSVISSTICINNGWGWGPMLLFSILSAAVLGLASGTIYVLLRLPAIIVSLGVTLLYEGAAFAMTDGYGVSFVTNRALTSFPGVPKYAVLISSALVFMIVVYDHTRFGYEYSALKSGQEIAVNMGIKEIPNTLACYTIAGALMGIVGFISATNTGTIQMSLNFGSIVTMFTAFLPMFIGSFIGRFTSDKIGYVLGAASTAFLSLAYARLQMDSSVQQIVTALVLVGFLIYLNNEQRILAIFRKGKGR